MSCHSGRVSLQINFTFTFLQILRCSREAAPSDRLPPGSCWSWWALRYNHGTVPSSPYVKHGSRHQEKLLKSTHHPSLHLSTIFLHSIPLPVFYPCISLLNPLHPSMDPFGSSWFSWPPRIYCPAQFGQHRFRLGWWDRGDATPSLPRPFPVWRLSSPSTASTETPRCRTLQPSTMLCCRYDADLSFINLKIMWNKPLNVADQTASYVMCFDVLCQSNVCALSTELETGRG